MLVVAVVAVAAALTGCGQADEGGLPPERAERLAATLREVARATTDGDCTLAQQFLGRAERRVADLPADVDERLVARLQEGLDRLRTQAPRECLPEQQPQTEPPATTSPQETVPPATTAPDEEDEPPAETTTEPPPDTQAPTTPVEPPPGEQPPGAGGSGGAGAGAEGDLQ